VPRHCRKGLPSMSKYSAIGVRQPTVVYQAAHLP